MKVRALCSFSGKRLSLGKDQTCETDSETAEPYIKIGFLEKIKVKHEPEAESESESELKPETKRGLESEPEPGPRANEKAVKPNEGK